MDKTAKIIDKIRKLQAYSGNGRTAEEQASFAAAVQRLMTDYKIEQWQLAQDGATTDDETIAFDVYSMREYREGAKFLALLLHAVATAHTCSVAIVGAHQDFYVFGTTTDRAVVRYMFEFLRAACGRCAEAAKRDIRANGLNVPRGTFLESFRTGFLRVIQDRYAAERQNVSQGSDQHDRLALVVTSRALARSDEGRKATLGEPTGAEEMSIEATNHQGWQAGREAAKDLPLHMQGLPTAGPGVTQLDNTAKRALPEGV